MRYAQTLEEAEALNSLYKAELIYLDGHWGEREEAEAATAEWVHWFNTQRLHGMLDYKTPTEAEAAHHNSVEEHRLAA